MLREGAVEITKDDALHSAIAMIPAVFAIMSGNVAGGAALAIGILPTSKMGIAATRKDRVKYGILGCMFGIFAFVGAHIIAIGIWQAALILFVIALLSSIVASRKVAGAMLLALIIPALGIGMGYTVEDVIGLTVLFIIGSLWSAFVSLFFPETEPDPSRLEAQKKFQPKYPVLYGVMLGLAGVTAIILGNIHDQGHVGWTVAASLLIMRPLAQMAGLRGITRAIATIIGTLLAVVVLQINPSLIVMAILIVTISMIQSGTRKSEWYISPFGTAFLLLTMLLYGSNDIAQTQELAWSRISDNILAAAIALFFGLLLPTLAIMYQKSRNLKKPQAM